MPEYPDNLPVALEHIRNSDPALGKAIDRVGHYVVEINSEQEPFESLLRSIVYQQLSGHAAKAIYNRLLELYPGKHHPSAEDLSATSPETLRSCGLSRSKVRAVTDLAEKTQQGLLPDRVKVQTMSDEDVIKAFSSVFGIGQWTCEMLLMFTLGRPDVLPGSDLGVRRGFMHAYRLDEMPSPQDVMARGELWKPYRSIASFYLWRLADGEEFSDW